MKTASIRDLHIRTSALVREAAQGEVIYIQRRGETVAELRPVTSKRSKALPDLTEFWNRMPQIPGDSTDIISEDRDRM
jgi:antitoxin (DNA-binding transcriptional repressor) of toxin-antitoxin stability system